ncbi:MAG: RHS repeat-associated core domain-containing protein [Thermoanaerobaculia bacterium]
MISAPPTADDERVLTLVDNPDPAVDEFRWSLRDFGGKVLRDFLSKPGVLLDTIQQEWIYRGDQLTAMVDVTEEDPQTMHFSLDHLGTTRLETDETGNVVKRWKYFPYGEDASPTAAGEPRLRFTGHERDTYSPMTNTDDLDWMHARFEAPGLGRFLSADPARLSSAARQRPQLWNRYTYVAGNPIRFTDPSGRCIEDLCIGEGAAITAGIAALENPAGQEALEAAEIEVAEVAGLAEAYLKPALQRGMELHETLGAKLGDALAKNFPTIDRFVRSNGSAISMKTIDLASKTYQRARALASRLGSYIKSLAEFAGARGGGEVVRSNDVQRRVLEIVVRGGDLTTSSAKAIAEAAQKAQAFGVTIRVVVIQ